MRFQTRVRLYACVGKLAVTLRNRGILDGTGIAVGVAVGLACLSAAGAALVVAVRARGSAAGQVQRLADGFGTRASSRPRSSPTDVLDRTLDAIVALPGVDAALVTIGDPAERTTRAAALSEDEVERTLLQMPSHPDLRSLEVVYRYRLRRRRARARSCRARRSRSRSAPRARRSARWRRSAAPTRPGFPESTSEALESARPPSRPRDRERACGSAEAREQAELDSLTGLHNRRLFYEFLAREIARAQRYERFVSLIVFDLDDFKRINDRIGHLGGDAVLAGVADRIRSVVRATDIACRVGGDEFAVILPESSRDDAELLADRIALAIKSQKIEKVGALKISAGVAELRSDDTAADLFKRADHALYRAKNAGKARIVAS